MDKFNKLNESYNTADCIFWYHMMYNIGSVINNLPHKNIPLPMRKNKRSYREQPKEDATIKLFYGYWFLIEHKYIK